MSSIYDISGTSADSFSLNGKCTLLQGNDAPEPYQGLDGDVYFQSNGAVYAKRNGSWLNLTSASLPDAETGKGLFLYSNGENYGFYELPVEDIVFKTGGGAIEADMNFAGNNTYSGDDTFTGNVTFTKPINGTAMYAYWGDLAECYESDYQYPKGTLVQFGGNKEITIATDDVNAVITSEPGFILNSQMPNGQAIALCGRVPVRVIGKVNKFDYLTLSELPGVAKVLEDDEYSVMNVVARALESKDSDEEGLVLCVVKFEI